MLPKTRFRKRSAEKQKEKGEGRSYPLRNNRLRRNRPSNERIRHIWHSTECTRYYFRNETLRCCILRQNTKHSRKESKNKKKTSAGFSRPDEPAVSVLLMWGWFGTGIKKKGCIQIRTHTQGTTRKNVEKQNTYCTWLRRSYRSS